MDSKASSWDPGLATGVKLIDADHQMLFEMIEALRTNPHLRDLSNMIVALVRYAAEHFEREERLMDHYEYPGGAAHKQLHIRFRQDMLAIRKTFAANPARVDPGKLADYLDRWLIGHIKGPDVDLVKFLHGDVKKVERPAQATAQQAPRPAKPEELVTVEVRVPAGHVDHLKRVANLLAEGGTAAAKVESLLAGISEPDAKEALARVENILV